MIKFVQIIWILSSVKPIPLRKYFVGSGPVFPTSVWPDLAIFCQLGKILKIFGNFMKVYLVFGKLLNLLWKNQCAFGPIYVVVNGQILSKHFRHLVTLVVCAQERERETKCEWERCNVCKEEVVCPRERERERKYLWLKVAICLWRLRKRISFVISIRSANNERAKNKKKKPLWQGRCKITFL